MFQDATMRLPMHGCPSYIKWHRDDKGYTSSVQVGADYNRIGDNDYTYMDSKEAAESVFLDAEKLTAFLASDFSAVEQENS